MRISDWSSDVCSSDLGLHWFIKSRAAQIPGVSTLVTILNSSGMLDSFDEAYRGAATVNQVLATSISSEASTEAVGQNLAPAVTNSVATQWGLFQKKLDYYSSVKMRIGGVRVPVMPPGDKLNMSARSAELHERHGRCLRSRLRGSPGQ